MKTFFITHLAIMLFLVPGINLAQVVTISGYVRSTTDGTTIENVNIFDRQSGVGTITNQKGFYKLVLQKGECDLIVSDNDYQTFKKCFNIDTNTIVEVNLNPKKQKNRIKKTEKENIKLAEGKKKKEK